ncbi:barwin-like endoglucanase [Tilletiopsis washingtonensis]|uniref:Barwin-like endoglucanase n=1 Tax=Tilletiopsis washingtonensis TaxID=58919 RepID=A0A316ZES7_9BASI|nr:barwin-like endoglucanase [Tilletiopsis washingtonensis]PWN98825.1 barwin-like endoglucanase [Tilletiopsis washingtonensis]
MQFLTLAVAALASLALVAGAPIEKRSQRGKATYYYQNGQPGSCGGYAGDNDRVVAISSKFKSARKCGGKLKITNTSNGKSVTARIADTCPTCAKYDIDLSVGAFKALGSMSKGVLNVDWYNM